MAENFFGITDTGKMRDNNEDAFLAETLPGGWIVACVIDGVGGYEGGEVAAGIARDTIQQQLRSLAVDPLATLRHALLLANQNIYNEKINNKGNSQMACVLTIALVKVDSNQFYYAHVGDTRLYLLRDQSLVKVTKDHSFVGFLEDSGRLTEKEAMTHPKRNEINKALGFDPQIDVKDDYIETGSSPFLSGDVLLLCSDGLSDLVDRETMTRVLLSRAPLTEKGAALITAANNAGGKDNITVVLVTNNKKPAKAKATKPVLIKKSERRDEPTAVAAPPVAPPPKQAPRKLPSPVRKEGNAGMWALAGLCLLLALSSAWLFFTRDKKETLAGTPERVRNEGEKKLSDSLALAAGVLSLGPANFGQSVSVSDTLFVRQDTLRINGNGILLLADSGYTGPAIVATANSKVLSLENIIFKNFATAIVLQGNGVQLRNVQFLNCKVPVQHHLFLSGDSAVSGVVKDSFIVSHNSLPK